MAHEPSFARRLWQRLSPTERRQLSRLRWVDRLTSLWSPVALFGLALVGYLMAIELSPCSALWLRPVMVGLLGLCGVVTAGLAAVRSLHRFGAERALRVRVEEHLSLLARGCGRRAAATAREQALDEAHGAVASLCAARTQEALALLVAALTRVSPGTRPGGVAEGVVGLAKALAIVAVVRLVVVEPYRIPSGSMLPTLEIGDQIFVNKLIYGVRVPLANRVLAPLWRDPARGDVIVFNNPVLPEVDYVKRVVGVPGDTIDVRAKTVYVNGVEQPARVLDPLHRSQDREFLSGIWFEREDTLLAERLGEEHHLGLRSRGAPEGTAGPYHVPPGHVFVMGDNRDNSLDSRFGLGRPELGLKLVPYGHIKGKAVVIWLSWSRGGLLADSLGGAGPRLDRFFLPVRWCAAGLSVP